MAKEILQLENINATDFENKLFNRVEQLINGLAKKLQTNDPDELLTREETAKLLSISTVTLWKYTNDDVVPAFRIGHKVRYKKSDVLAALKQMNKFSS